VKRLALFCVLLFACAEPKAPDAVAEIGAPATPGDPAVAVVNGSPILRTEVLLRRAERDGGPVLDDLVLEDLLAAEAARQGLRGDAEVREAVHRAMVQRLLIDDFEKKLRPEDVPEGMLRRAYELNFWFYNRPEIRHFEHLLVRCGMKEPDDKVEKARRLAEELLETLQRRPTLDMANLPGEVRARAGELGIEVVYEKGPGNRERLEKPFADLLFSLAPGELAKRIVRSRFGWHVVRHIRFVPALSRPFEVAREDVLKRVWPEYRQGRLRGWLRELRAKYGAKVAASAHLLFRAKTERKAP
jgi:parvulin-like peptidyl-prolyl isomerase